VAYGPSDPTLARGTLTSDPTQFAPSVYYVNKATPRRTLTYRGWFSDVIRHGHKLIDYRYGGDLSLQRVGVPIPVGLPAANLNGDDNISLINTDTGDEWDVRNFSYDASGNPIADGVGHYNVGWSGVPPYASNSAHFGDPWWLGGAGIPYMAGTVHPCEIAQGNIDHALAFAYQNSGPGFVRPPASKSDGNGNGLPEGARLQLDPGIPDSTIASWTATDSSGTVHGCGYGSPCFIAAKALQKYGMYNINTSGHLKVAFEFDGTAHWNGTVTYWTVAPIPMTDFKVVNPG
jgi:hypothetical protein